MSMSNSDKNDALPPAEEMAAHYTIKGTPACHICNREIHAGDEEPKHENGDTVGILYQHNGGQPSIYCEDHIDDAVRTAEGRDGVAVIKGPFVTQFSLPDTYGIWAGEVELVYPEE